MTDLRRNRRYTNLTDLEVTLIDGLIAEATQDGIALTCSDVLRRCLLLHCARKGAAQLQGPAAKAQKP